MAGQVPLLGQLINRYPLAGVGQEGGGAPAGLQGLFTYLLQGREVGLGLAPVEGGGELFSTLFSSEQVSGVSAEEGTLLDRLSKVLDDMTSLLEQAGDAPSLDVSVVRVQVQKISVTLQQAGVDVQQVKDASQLAQAFETLGMPTEEAQTHAARVELALATMEVLQNQSFPAQATLAQSGGFSGLGAQTTLSRTTVEITQVQVSQFYGRQGGVLARHAAQAPVLNISEKIQLDLPLQADVLSAGRKGVYLAPGQQALSEEGEGAPLSTGTQVRFLGSIAVGQESMDEVAQRVLPLDGLSKKDMGNDISRLVTFEGAEEGDLSPGSRGLVKDTLLSGTSAGGGQVDVEEGFKPLEVMAERLERAERKENPLSSRRTEGPDPLRGTTIYRLQPTNTGADVLTKVNELPLTPALVDQGGEGLEIADGIRSEQGSENRTSFAARVAQFSRAANIGLQAQPMIKALAEQGGGQVRVTLRPAELGEIEIDLRIHEGRVQGTIAAQNPEVVEQLARELQLLKQGLADAGYQLGDEGLAFMLQEDGSGGAEDQASDQEDSLMAEEGALEEETHVAKSWVNPDRMVDVKI
jgi:hypothetical protein